MNLVMFGAIENIENFCGTMAGPLQFVGIVLWVFKVAIPVIIFVMGMIDLGKAVTASKDDEIKKAMKQLMIRLLSGVLIFFIPTLVIFVFGLLADFGTASNNVDFDTCKTCILSPLDKDCTDALKSDSGTEKENN